MEPHSQMADGGSVPSRSQVDRTDAGDISYELVSL
jgi:hypothetical protein